MQLTPHKSVEPFVIQIEDRTGIVKKVDPVKRTEFTANEAVDRYFIAKYISEREAYNPSTRTVSFNNLRVSSSKDVFAEYRNASSEANPNSPAALLGSDGVRTIEFRHIAFLPGSEKSPYGEKTAQANITLIDRSRTRPDPKYYHAIVTITFSYAKLNLNETERYMNPLGFTVTRYVIGDEVINNNDKTN
jgi:type IV secretion system protein VirB8